MAGIGGIGRPTLMELAHNQTDLTRGPLRATERASDKQSQGATFPLYPTGPVELHMPIHLPQGETDGEQEVRVWLTYMTCNENFCLRPVEREEVIITLPRSANGVAGTWEIPDTTDINESALPQQTGSDLKQLSTGKWYFPQNVSELEAILAAAEAAGKPAFLDFTGPSCLNCQIMKQTVYVLPSVQNAFNSLVLISINTDPPACGFRGFPTGNLRHLHPPFYVRTAADKPGQSWSTFFRPGNEAELSRFTGFLGGGLGDGVASAEGHEDSIAQSGGWGGFLLLAILGIVHPRHALHLSHDSIDH